MQDYHQLDIWNRRFVGYAYRSLKEVVTCVELTQRLQPSCSGRYRGTSWWGEPNCAHDVHVHAAPRALAQLV